jgi:mobilome CxxCx(11)CxxC protein
MRRPQPGYRLSLRRRRPSQVVEQEIQEAALALRSQCWDDALNAYGTSYVFQRRARSLKLRVQWITYIGFAVPMIVGLLVLAYGHLKSLPVIIAVAGAIGIGQVAISLWAIVGGWVDGASYAATSASANGLLATAYQELGSNPPSDLRDFQHQYDLLKVEDRSRTEQDFQQGVKESEKHMGTRAALRRYQRPCAVCGKVPETMKASDCGVCGDFPYKIR